MIVTKSAGLGLCGALLSSAVWSRISVTRSSAGHPPRAGDDPSPCSALLAVRVAPPCRYVSWECHGVANLGVVGEVPAKLVLGSVMGWPLGQGPPEGLCWNTTVRT
jgi:hypothetical protein